MNESAMTPTPASGSEIFLGRQPILDGKRKIVAYELLFRSEESLEEANFTDDLAATAAVIVNTLSQFGLQNVLGTHDGFMNVSASLLMSETVELLPPERIVLEILEDVPISPPILERCKALKEKGFRLALDDFSYRSEYDPILPFIDYIKVDLSITPLEKMAPALAQIRKLTSATLLAERVETEIEYEECKQLGFGLFQGYFFAKATLLRGKKPQPHQMSLMRIMGLLLGDANVSELEPLFKDNPGLTLGLLRLVNSVGIGGGRQQVSSLRQAIVILGQKQLLRWVQLLLYAAPDGSVGSSLLQQVANRARLMELLAQHAPSIQPNLGDQAFMVGMLSLADAVMQMPLEDVLTQIGVTDTLKDAVLKREGILGELLVLAEVIELGDFAEADKHIHAIGMSVSDFTNIQLEAMQWTNDLSREIA